MLCPRCGNEIPADDVNLDNLVAKCPGCNEVFSFADQLPARPAKAPAVAKRVPRPAGITVVDDSERRQVVRRWFTWAILFLIFFCVFWDGFLVVWYAIVFGLAGGGPGRGMSLIMALFPILHVAVGVGLTYFTLASLVNTTVAEVADGRLRVRHGPLPWPGNRDLDAAEVRQLYCAETTSQGRSGATYYRYTLNAVLADDRTVPLLANLDNKTTALFYEQQLEDWLGVKPEHVPGEVEP